MAIEKKRLCGYRKVGGLYLVGSGMPPTPCDILPIELKPCPTCGFIPSFNRGYMTINKRFIMHYSGLHHEQLEKAGLKCLCKLGCPLCYPGSNDLEKYGIMWVGREYTPDSFIREAQEMGVSKRIAKIPKSLVLGKTWVLLAHRKVPFQKDVGGLKSEPVYKPGIFYAFIPRRVEKLIWKSQATEKTLAELRKQGITPIVVPDGDKDHAPKL